MNHPPARIVCQLLVDLGLSAGFGSGSGAWRCFTGDEPDTPDEVLTVYDTDGPTFGRIQKTGEVTGHDGFQIRIRSNLYQTGWDKGVGVIEALSQTVYQRTVSVGSEAYVVQAVNGLASLLALGRDKPSSRRCLFTVNGTVVFRQL